MGSGAEGAGWATMAKATAVLKVEITKIVERRRKVAPAEIPRGWRTDRYRNAARRARLRRARRHLRWLTLHAGTIEAMCRADAVRREVGR